MAHLLYLEASPRKKRSASIEVSKIFLEEYQKIHPNDEIHTIDLWQKDIPSFDGDVIEAKYAILHGQAHTEAERKGWRMVEQTIAEFKQADKYLISLPMWNFGIPYKLKHYIDVIVQPSYTFSYSPNEGYKGLVTNKPAILICARGGSYGPESGANALDMQVSYMENVLKFIGFNDIHSILIEPTLAPPQQKEEALKKAEQEAIQMAQRF